jgi:hypothetical protein
LKLRDDVAHYTGLRTCASPHSCPICSTKIAAGRVQELTYAIDQALLARCGIAFLTLTFAHYYGQSLAHLIKARQEAWRLVTYSRTWRRLKAEYGIEYVRIAEHTWGPKNGWHPHYHFAIVTDRWLSEAERLVIEAQLSVTWRTSLAAVGLSGTIEHALRLDPWRKTDGDELASYLAKSLALEVAAGGQKAGREGRLTPWGLLDAAQDGEAEPVQRWREHEKATKGRRTIAWSKGMNRYRCPVEVTDEELAAAEVGGAVVLTVDRATKNALWHASPRGVALLEACEKGGQAAAIAYVTTVLPAGSHIVLPNEGEP